MADVITYNSAATSCAGAKAWKQIAPEPLEGRLKWFCAGPDA